MENFDQVVNHHDNVNTQPAPEKASTGIRFFAFMIDHIIICIILLTPFMLLANSTSNPYNTISLYPFLMLAAFFAYALKDIIKGQSLGKYLLGIAVRNRIDPSEKPSTSKLFLRNIFTLIWPIEFLVLTFGAQKTKIGDKIAGTDVYYISKKSKGVIFITVIFVIVGFFISMNYVTSIIVKNDPSYEVAINYIETNPELLDLLGDIEGYRLSNKSLTYSGRYGQADYTIKVIGRHATIHVHLKLEKTPDTDWEIFYFDYRR